MVKVLKKQKVWIDGGYTGGMNSINVLGDFFLT